MWEGWRRNCASIGAYDFSPTLVAVLDGSNSGERFLSGFAGARAAARRSGALG